MTGMVTDHVCHSLIVATLQLAGGTNGHTAGALAAAGLLHTGHIGGVAFGGHARKQARG